MSGAASSALRSLDPDEAASIAPRDPRRAVKAGDRVPVTRGSAPSSPILHLLVPGSIVVIAEEARVHGARRMRISSPAGWIDADALEAAVPLEPTRPDFASFERDHRLVAPGDHYGLEFPFTVEQLRLFGARFLTRAFQAAGTIGKHNAVTKIVALEPLSTMGASESAFLSVEYAEDEPGLHKRLFVKFPPDKGLEYKYSLTSMSRSEVAMQRLAGACDLPFAVAKYYFGDYCSRTTNYILITERIEYGVPPIEVAHRKGYDHRIDSIDEHYLVMTKALAGLVAAHKSGALVADVERVFPFAAAARNFDPISTAEASVDRLFDFVGRVAPQLFVAEAADPAFLQRWGDDLLFGLAHKDAVIAYLHADVDYTGVCHPNLNLDNAWFWRDADGKLHVGLIDWGGAGQMSIAQALSGMLMMPIPESYLALQRQVIRAFIEDYARMGGVKLDAEEMLFQYKASVFSTAICTIVAFVVDMLFQFSEEEYRTMTGRSDQRLLDNGLYAAIVWIDNMLRDWLDEVTPGQACRLIVDRRSALAKVAL